MKKFILFFLLAILGCQSMESERSLTDKVEAVPTAAAEADNDHFSVHVLVPEQVEVNESFTIDAILQNISEQTLEMTTGNPLFYYIIRDSTGKAINTITRTDIGIVRTMDKKEIISEEHSYRFKNPGVYEITAVAEFTLQDGDSGSKVYKMEAEREKIEVMTKRAAVRQPSFYRVHQS